MLNKKDVIFTSFLFFSIDKTKIYSYNNTNRSLKKRCIKVITTLHIKNIGIIEDLSIDFNKGFNVLTGETGAGKTLIIDSLGIISGGRFSKEMIRKGENYSFVEACFYLPEHAESVDGNIIISREIYDNGRNTCKINGRLVTVSELKNFMKNIIDIHGQHDNQSIMEVSFHIKYLDSFIGDDIKNMKKEYEILYKRFNSIKEELKQNYGDDKERQRKLDLLKYQFNEIEDAKLKVNEEEELEEKRKILLNSEKIAESLIVSTNLLDETIIDGINTSIRALEKIQDIKLEYKDKLESLRSIYYDIQEITVDLNDEKEKIDFDEEEREEIEQRLNLIYSLKRKYGNNIHEILKYKENLENEIEIILNLEDYTNKLKKESKQIEEQMIKYCNKMDEIRREHATILSEKINKELVQLEMKNARFNIKIEINNQYNVNGFNNVEFFITTNIGEDAKPLIKIASGGELSRIMLAIKSVLADVDEVSTMIFDEIDTGISGSAAKAVSQKMKKISNKHQILVITHLPVIAASADYNYYISKCVIGEKTKTNVKTLKEEEIVSEIARMLAGDITDVTIENAKELRNIRTKISA